MLQLEAAKADRASVQGDITYRNNRIEEVQLSPQAAHLFASLQAASCLFAFCSTLQAEVAWRKAAAGLEALTKTHDGVLGQLKEAQDRTALAEQETIEVSPICMPWAA